MRKLTNEEIMSVKGRGFLRNRGTDRFSGRIVAPGTVFSAENFRDLSELAARFGNGKLIPTSRLCIEIPGISFDNIPLAEEFAASHGLAFGGTGAKVRPITACKGSTCVFGNCDTHAIAKRIHDEFYIGWAAVKLPHKFKIAVGGCPNSCMKPSLNDVGIEGRRVPVFDADKCRACKVCAVEKACPSKAVSMKDGKAFIDKSVCLDCGVCTGKCPFGAVASETKTVYKIYIGGTWGKKMRMGSALSRYFEEDEIYSVLEKAILWFKENAEPKERFGKAIDRVGFERAEAEILGDEILSRKAEILAK